MKGLCIDRRCHYCLYSGQPESVVSSQETLRMMQTPSFVLTFATARRTCHHLSFTLWCSVPVLLLFFHLLIRADFRYFVRFCFVFSVCSLYQRGLCCLRFSRNGRLKSSTICRDVSVSARNSRLRPMCQQGNNNLTDRLRHPSPCCPQASSVN